MEWCPLCVLILLIFIYIGVTATIITVAVLSASKGMDTNVVLIIVFVSILASIVITCIIYYLVRSCNAVYLNVHPHPDGAFSTAPNHHPTPNHPTPNHPNHPPPPKPFLPISLQTKPGTLVEHPTGELQIAIYEHPTTNNE